MSEQFHLWSCEGYEIRFEQEQGVSRMLTINLNDVEKQLNIR